MAGSCSPDKRYCAYFTEVQDIEDHCVDDSQDDENAGSDGWLCHFSLVAGLPRITHLA